ncbi:MAG TPA: antitoxin family protein [Pirellulales bacterium]|jgi:predicted DNA-binding antitoxin AbrB/MazE fold protein|nr:antitoxin family protein [Pirellulales bacterium]
MQEPITAIYENGVLKPLHPVDLKEHAVVSLTILGKGEPLADEHADAVRRQRTALAAMLEETAMLPLEGAQDQFSNRDHDLVL